MPADDRRPAPSPLGRAFVQHPHPVLAELREGCPVARVDDPRGRPVWVVTRAEDVRAGLLDPRLSLQHPPPAPGARPYRALELSLVDYDPPHHTRIRRLAAPAFAPQRVERYRQAAETTAAALLAPLPADRPADLMSAFARPFSFRVLCEAFATPEAARADLLGWMTALFDRRGRTPADIQAATDGIERHVRDEIAARRRAPGSDLLSAIATAWQPDGDVTEDELVSLCAMVLLAGFDSTAQMIGLCVRALLTHPDLYARLRADPALVPAAVDELLRWDTPAPFSTRRRALADITLGDTVIPAGSGVLLAMAAANRDPRHHPDPDTLDLDRPGAARHLAFGLGPHYCLGSALARLELCTALTALLRHRPAARLAVPAAELSWRGGCQHRVLAALPVLLGTGVDPR
ncbi:cytochrome P450 [Peterkaempfera bronchialis]|uniref:Cytochrome P450 n=1 Tax=Peterkaempfera bronchialis TaxID=2126346 RepID=A0A345SZM5_9ACTN|nr:cytochrome P450 [Peterkaempfera bronchialis]AXI79180.1 cytochrome P450 [Peterkaempfera bronchialis]